MAQQQPPDAQQQETAPQPEPEFVPIKAPWPAPPPFYKNFTKDNTAELRRLRKEAGIPSSDNTSTEPTRTKDIDPLSLPPELRYLLPPQPPADGAFTLFGRPTLLDPKPNTLAEAGIERLYPDRADVYANPQPHLIALARSLLIKYLHLLGVLSQNPVEAQTAPRIKEMKDVVFNMHDLINRYRPHQARESLILMMEERVRRLRGEIRGIEDVERRVGEMVGGWEDGKVKEENDGMDEVRRDEVGDDGTEVRKRQMRAWEALGREMGDV